MELFQFQVVSMIIQLPLQAAILVSVVRQPILTIPVVGTFAAYRLRVFVKRGWTHSSAIFGTGSAELFQFQVLPYP